MNRSQGKEFIFSMLFSVSAISLRSGMACRSLRVFLQRRTDAAGILTILKKMVRLKVLCILYLLESVIYDLIRCTGREPDTKNMDRQNMLFVV